MDDILVALYDDYDVAASCLATLEYLFELFGI
jgi:hypothetical protein